MKNVSQDALGLYSFNFALIEQLKNYLNLKEARLANAIIYHIFPKAASQNIPLPSHEVKLLPLVQHLKDHLSHESQEKEQIKISAINLAFWEYVQVLEENIGELFQRINRLEISDWHHELYAIISDLYELLLHQVNNAIESIGILEEAFQKLKSQKIFNFWIRKILDKNLFKNLRNSKTFLIDNYYQFQKKFGIYSEIASKVTRKAKKFKNFICFSQLDKQTKSQFLKLYKTVGLWESNQNVKIFKRSDFLQELKQNSPLFRSFLVLKQYLESLQVCFFRICEEWRLARNSEQLEDVEFLKKELLALGATIEKYRNLLLSTDPNPYVRSRLGFKEWVVGPEPKTTKEILEFVYNLEDLKRLMSKFENSVQQMNSVSDTEEKKFLLTKGIQNLIHELGQPLVSKSFVRSRFDKLLELVDECDELAGSAGEVSGLITEALLNAFRIDWHYQLLLENPKFQEILTIHKHCEKMEKEFFHQKRINHFNQMIHNIENWVRQNDSFRHMHELETDISDAKEQLQVYLSHVKRRLDSLDGIEKSLYVEQVKLQLLEYYEVFNRFFFFLKNYEANGKIILNQFKFIDSYLEAIRQSLYQ